MPARWWPRLKSELFKRASAQGRAGLSHASVPVALYGILDRRTDSFRFLENITFALENSGFITEFLRIGKGYLRDILGYLPWRYPQISFNISSHILLLIFFIIH